MTTTRMVIVLREELGRQQSRVGKVVRELEVVRADIPVSQMTDEEKRNLKKLRQARESFTRLETAAIALGSLQLGDIEDETTA